jgi:hypothetical protein
MAPAPGFDEERSDEEPCGEEKRSRAATDTKNPLAERCKREHQLFLNAKRKAMWRRKQSNLFFCRDVAKSGEAA